MSDRDSLYRYASQEWCAGTELQAILIRAADKLGEIEALEAQVKEQQIVIDAANELITFGYTKRSWDGLAQALKPGEQE